MRTKPAIYLLSVLVVSLLVMTACQSPEVTSAKVYFQQENIDAAEEQLLIALEKEPMNPEVPYLLASGVYAPRNDYDKSLEMLAKAVELDPSYKDKADQFHKKFWADTHTEGANHFNNALRAVFPAEKDSLLRLAAARFERALELKDDETVTYNGLAKCYFMLEDTAQVIAVTDAMRDKDLFDKDVFYYYGQVIWEPGKEEEALAKLTEIVSQYPDAVDVQLLRIRYLSDLERFDEALAVAQQLSTENPDNLDIVFILAQIYSKTGDLESAQYEFQKVLAANPDDIEVILRIAEAYFKSKDWVLAEEYARKAIDIDPENVFAYDILWKSVYNQGRIEEAEEYRQIEKSLQ